jgi:hypothetical protein
LHRDLWVEEVFKHRDGRWQVYSQVSPDKCYFKSLREALDCAERLAGEYLIKNGLRASRVGSISGRKPFCRNEGGLPSIFNMTADLKTVKDIYRLPRHAIVEVTYYTKEGGKVYPQSSTWPRYPIFANRYSPIGSPNRLLARLKNNGAEWTARYTRIA